MHYLNYGIVGDNNNCHDKIIEIAFKSRVYLSDDDDRDFCPLKLQLRLLITNKSHNYT